MKQEIPVDPAPPEPRLVQGPDWSIHIDPAPPEPPLPWWTVEGGLDVPASRPLQRWGWADLWETTIWNAALYLTGRDPNPRLLGNSASEYPPDNDDLMNWLGTNPESEALFCRLRDAVESKAIGSAATKDSKGAPLPWGGVRIRWGDAYHIARNGSPIAPRPVKPSVELDGPARRYSASEPEIHEVMMVIYETEQLEGRCAPNLSKLPSLVRKRLAKDGKKAAPKDIDDVADWFPFPALRNPTGEHLTKKPNSTNPDGLSGLSGP